MKIVDIFANRKLHAFHYDGQDENELDRLLSLWNDTEYLYEFVKTHQNDVPKDVPIYKLINQITDDANIIDDTLLEIAQDDGRDLDEFFRPLYNQEYRVVELSLQKGRVRYLRLYALRIDRDIFVITGGAIKFTHLINDRPHTLHEFNKLKQCQAYLKEQGVFDNDSFFEFINQDL